MSKRRERHLTPLTTLHAEVRLAVITDGQGFDDEVQPGLIAVRADKGATPCPGCYCCAAPAREHRVADDLFPASDTIYSQFHSGTDLVQPVPASLIGTRNLDDDISTLEAASGLAIDQQRQTGVAQPVRFHLCRNRVREQQVEQVYPLQLSSFQVP